jgi:hypothetical protein
VVYLIKEEEFNMRKTIILIAFFLLLALVNGCSSNKGVETKSTIVSKDTVNGNYYFMVTYKIEGMEGNFEATIKIDKKVEFDKYSVGDEYIFYRPSPK